MKYSFSISQVENDGEILWVAESQELKNCLGVGETQDEALAELAENEVLWLEMAKENNFPIPEPRIWKLPTFSGKLTLRLSPKEHELAAKQAEVSGLSLNQYINNAVVAYNRESFSSATELHEIHEKVTRIVESAEMSKLTSIGYTPEAHEITYLIHQAQPSHKVKQKLC